MPTHLSGGVCSPCARFFPSQLIPYNFALSPNLNSYYKMGDANSPIIISSDSDSESEPIQNARIWDLGAHRASSKEENSSTAEHASTGRLAALTAAAAHPHGGQAHASGQCASHPNDARFARQSHLPPLMQISALLPGPLAAAAGGRSGDVPGGGTACSGPTGDHPASHPGGEQAASRPGGDHPDSCPGRKHTGGEHTRGDQPDSTQQASAKRASSSNQNTVDPHQDNPSLPSAPQAKKAKKSRELRCLLGK